MMLDGVPLTVLDPTWLRSLVGVVSQVWSFFFLSFFVIFFFSFSFLFYLFVFIFRSQFCLQNQSTIIFPMEG